MILTTNDTYINNQMLERKKLLYSILGILGLFLCSCGKEDSYLAEKTLVPSATIPATTSTMTSTITSTPTLTETPPSVTPSPTLMPIVYASVPTLSPNQAVDYFFSMYGSLAECEPPCWGEIIPGETKIEEVQQILGPISKPIKYSDDTYVKTEEGTEILYSVTSWRRDFGTLLVGWGVYGENGIVSEVYFYTEGTNRTLSHILTTYGQPDEVWLDAPVSIYSDGMIKLGLYYIDENIFVKYAMDGVINNDNQGGCGVHHHKMYVWSELSEELSYMDTYRGFYGGAEAEWLKEKYNLESITEWTIESFYEEFKDKNDQEVCISGPLENWD